MTETPLDMQLTDVETENKPVTAEEAEILARLYSSYARPAHLVEAVEDAHE